LKQFEYLQEELSRKKEESIQLRSVLASKQPNEEVLNGDDEHEIGLILKTQKTVSLSCFGLNQCQLPFMLMLQVIQQLEKELQDGKAAKNTMEQNYRSEITKLKEELATVFTHLKSPQNQNELLLQHQIQRLTTENLNLRSKNDDLQHQLHKLPALDLVESTPGSGPMIHKMKRNYTGMLQYQDEVKLTRILIIDLKPKIAMNALPGLPAYIIFMCIRYTDNLNDDDKVRKLLTSVIQTVKKVINKKGTTDFEVSVLWLGNVLRLLHTLKQYSGDPSFQRENTSIQNEQALKNFDLSEYRQVLSDVAVWIYIVSSNLQGLLL
jgi:myosin-5